jgi:hypothetical protein
VPAELVGLITRLLSKLPDGRPQSAGAVVAALATLDDMVADARSTGHLKRRRPERAERAWWVTAVQMLALAALGGAIYWFGPTAYQAISDRVDDALTEIKAAGQR